MTSAETVGGRFWQGERDPRKLASLANYRVKKSRAQIEAALTGDCRPELLSPSNDFTSRGDGTGSYHPPLARSAPAPKAIAATARKLGCLIYRLIKNGQGHQDTDLHIYELKYKDQVLNSLRKRANSFGFDLVEAPKAA